MKYLALLSLIFIISCTKTPEPEPMAIINCAEQGIYPIFRHKLYFVTKYSLVTYENNNSFNKIVSVQERYASDDSMGKPQYPPLDSKYQYDIQVPGHDTFRISGFVNTPTKDTFYGRRANYNHCYYYNQFVIVNGDSTKPDLGQYFGKFIVDHP